MVVRLNTTKLETASDRACSRFECGLADDNVEEASRLIDQGGAALKISVYPWGVEFDIVTDGAGYEGEEGNTDALV